MYKNEFRHHACFSLLVLSVKKNSNYNTYHIPNSQLEIQIIAEYTQPRCVGTAAKLQSIA